MPQLVKKALKKESDVKTIAAKYSNLRNFYFLGRRYNYPSALEGALKLKEVCPLIHAEGYAAGEGSSEEREITSMQYGARLYVGVTF